MLPNEIVPTTSLAYQSRCIHAGCHVQHNGESSLGARSKIHIHVIKISNNELKAVASFPCHTN